MIRFAWFGMFTTSSYCSWVPTAGSDDPRCFGTYRNYVGFLVLLGGILTWMSVFSSGCSDSSNVSDTDGSVFDDTYSNPADTLIGNEDTNTGDIAEEDSGVPVVTDPNKLTLVEITPAKGLKDGGEVVTLVGNGFKQGLEVWFGAEPGVNVQVLDNKLASVLAPPGNVGKVDVRVALPDGQQTILSDAFRYFDAFGIDLVEPASGPVKGGTPVVIHGYGFVPESLILFGTTLAISIVVKNDTTIEAIVPSGTAVGFVPVQIVTPAGVQSKAEAFRYVSDIEIKSMTPTAGFTTGGENVVLSGAGLSGDLDVYFGDKLATIVAAEIDGSEVTVEIPAHSVGFVDVVVENESDSLTVPDGFFYIDPASLDAPTQVYAVIPQSGPTVGGIAVAIVTSGLTSVFDTKIKFGNTKANPGAIDPIHGVLDVLLPAGPAGITSVTVSTANGTHTLNDAFTYVPYPVVESISPVAGPHTGGTEVTLGGPGVGAATEVRFGPLATSSIKVLDDDTIVVTTPPGTPGPANVTVKNPAGTAIRQDFYEYVTDTTQILALDPPDGSMSGGTLVTIIGTNLPNNGLVRFGDELAPKVEWKGATKIVVTTPPAVQPVAVDVVIKDQTTGQETVLPDGFTYFNPANAWGGTWGKPAQGTLNVSVLDIFLQKGIEDAWVVLWQGDDPAYIGKTNWLGQTIFSGPNLQGVQMITAWKPAYSASSIVEFDAENATVLLFPDNPVSEGGGGGGAAPDPFAELGTIVGKVKINEKYLIPPIGTCGAPKGNLCKPCEEDAQCNDPEGGVSDNKCTVLIDAKSYCTTACESGATCPSGYACIATKLGETKQCVPLSAQVRIRCMTSTSTLSSTNPGESGQGAEADIVTGQFQLKSRLGEVAVICQAELYKPATMTVFPIAMGAAFPVLVESAKVTGGVEVVLDVPLNRTVDFAMDYPPSKLEALPNHRVRMSLQFGQDGAFGFHEITRMSFLPGEGQFSFDYMPQSLSGSLEGVQWILLGGAFSEESTWVQWFPPYSGAIMRNLPGIAEDHLLVPATDGYTASKTKLGPIAAFWGPADNTVFAAGENGSLYYHDGTSWVLQGGPYKTDWVGLWGVDNSAVFAIGKDGGVIAWDGFVWTQIGALGFEPKGITGRSVSDVTVVGVDGQIRHYDGENWNTISTPTTATLEAAWSDPTTDVTWVVGDNGTILRLNNQGIQDFTVPNAATWYAIVGTSSTDVTICGEFGAIRRYDGAVWAKVQSGTTQDLHALWKSPTGEITTVGTRGTIVRIAQDGTVVDQSLDQSGNVLRAVWGNANGVSFIGGRDSVLFGPLLEVPEFLPPLAGGKLLEPLLQWSIGAGPQPSFFYMRIGDPWYKPIWQVMTAGDVSSVVLPDLGTLFGEQHLQGTGIGVELTAVVKKGFDIDNFSYITIYQPELWDAWSVNRIDISTFP